MKIFFSGSIRGGRDEDDKKVFKTIHNILKKHGTVFTELIEDEMLTAPEEIYSTDEEIFQRDIKWLGEVDLVVAEVSKPSIGVGYEIGRAEAMKKKILCLYRSGNVSAMVLGNPGINKVEYTVDNLEEKLAKLL